MRFHINTFDGVLGTSYYAVTWDGRESETYIFRWRAWLAGWMLSRRAVTRQEDA